MIRFGAFELDEHSQQLTKKGIRIRLQAKPFHLLLTLLERPGDVVTREEFHKLLWPGDTFGEFDHNLNNAINKLRRSLNDCAATPLYIETLPRAGYRFIAPVERVTQPVEPQPIAHPVIPQPIAPAAPRGIWWLSAACLIIATIVAGFGYSWSRQRAVAATLPDGVKKNPEAYEFYLKGRHFWNKRDKSQIFLAISYFQEALAKDPVYALAYSGIADSYSVLGMTSPNPHDLYQRAREAALASVKLDDKSAETHASLGLVYLCAWRFEEANHEFRKAIELNPRYPTAHHWYGLQLRDVGRLNDGLNELQLAHRLDPTSLPISFALANAYRKDGYFAEAAKQFAEIVRFDATFHRVNAGLAMLDANQLRPEASREEDPDVTENVAVGLYQSGKKKEAVDLIARLSEETNLSKDHCFPFLLAAMGEKDASIECLEKGFAEGAGYIPQIKTDPVLRDLRSDPRFQKLLNRVGFPSGVALASQ